MKFSVAAFLTAVISTVSTVYAQEVPNAGVAINLPSFGQVVNAGTTFTIKWTVGTNSTTSTNINSISLMRGSSGNLEYYISDILSGPIPVTPDTYNWAVPATIETGSAYALALAGDNGFTTYSTYFTIIGAPAGTVNVTSAAPPVVGGATSAAASGAASGAAPAATTAAGKGSKESAASAPAASSTSGANSIKAGLVGVVGAAGAVALLL